nr:hypothetical protein [Tanacetum cinerariifolium]
MDQSPCVEKTCLGKNIIEISSNKAEEEDDIEPWVVLGRSFLRLTKAIADFRTESVTIYPRLDPFLISFDEEEKIDDDWDIFLDNIDFGNIPNIGVNVSQRKPKEKHWLSLFVKDTLLEEERPVIETMTYNDKYKKILDEICLHKLKLEGMTKEEEETIIKVKGEALIEKIILKHL